MTAEMWIAVTVQNKTYVMPASHLTEVVNDGDFILILAHGIDPQRIANLIVNKGIVPEMRYVTAHRLSRSRVGRPSRPVQCVETGAVYKSINACAQAVGSAVGNLSNHLKYPDVFKSVKGHTFRYYSGS